MGIRRSSEKHKEDNPMFSRGYSSVRSRIEKKSRFTMSCYNCEYYYQSEEDDKEVCQNPDVLKYDMVVTETSIYCSRWEMCKRIDSPKSIFKKRRTGSGR